MYISYDENLYTFMLLMRKLHKHLPQQPTAGEDGKSSLLGLSVPLLKYTQCWSIALTFLNPLELSDLIEGWLLCQALSKLSCSRLHMVSISGSFSSIVAPCITNLCSSLRTSGDVSC